MKIKCEMTLLVLVGLIFLLHQGLCLRTLGSDGNCNIDSITEQDWSQFDFPDNIQDIDTDKQIIQSKYENIIGYTHCQSKISQCPLDIDIDESSKTIVIKTNTYLSEVDNGERGPSVKELLATLTFSCSTGTRDLAIKLKIVDTNNHAPTFSKDSYEYTFPMPIPPGIDLTQFGANALAVQDLDFSNQRITLTSNYDELKYTISNAENGLYVLKLEFLKITRLPNDFTFTLTATDSGEKPLSSSVEVQFKIDEKNSEPYIPAFIQPSFTYDYDTDTKNIKPGTNDGEVTLKEEAKNIQCEVSGEYSSYFDTPTVDGRKIGLNLKTNFPDEILEASFIKITIGCHLSTTPKSEGYSDVVISLPKTKQSASFSQILYNAEYVIEKDQHSVKMDDYIEIKGSLDNINIKVGDAYKTYFGIEETGSNTWSIKKIKNLDSISLQSTSLKIGISLIFKEEAIDEGIVMLLLPNGETAVSFTLPMFSGSYTIDKKGTANLKIDSNIQLNSKYVEVTTCSLQGEYQDYFSVNYNTDTNAFDLNILKDLPKKVIQGGLLSLILEVELQLGSLQQKAETSILLQLYDDSSSTTTTTEEPTTTTTTTETPTTRTTTTTTVEPTTTKTTSEVPTTVPVTTTSTEEPTTKNPDDQCDCDNTVWIVMSIVLCIILVIYMVATLLYYFMKIRKRQDARRLSSNEPTVQPHFQKKISHDSKYRDVSTRRPTGFIRYNPEVDKDSLNSKDKDEELNNNTHANKAIDIPTESFRKISGGAKNVMFTEAEKKPTAEPMSLNEELKKAVQNRGNLI